MCKGKEQRHLGVVGRKMFLRSSEFISLARYIQWSPPFKSQNTIKQFSHPSFSTSDMSFRKRNVGISDGRRPQASASTPSPNAPRLPGVRPSAADGRPVTSTGTVSLDGLLAGHGGQPLGTSILLEENGTTDYAGALLRFYAAEGLIQSHFVYIVGLPEQWGRELPGLATDTTKKSREPAQDEKMRIAWRYESLGQHGADTAGRGG